MLDSSPFGAGEIYASVNDYTVSFDPCNQGDFCHLVMVNIPWGNPTIFSLINFIINFVGTFVKGVLRSDDHHISLVIETTLKLFPTHGRHNLLDTEVTTIFFEYEGPNLWCYFCFSYKHLSSRCRHTHPHFFSSSALILDVAAENPTQDMSQLEAPDFSIETGTRSQGARQGGPREIRNQGKYSRQLSHSKPKRSRLCTREPRSLRAAITMGVTNNEGGSEKVRPPPTNVRKGAVVKENPGGKSCGSKQHTLSST